MDVDGAAVLPVVPVKICVLLPVIDPPEYGEDDEEADKVIDERDVIEAVVRVKELAVEVSVEAEILEGLILTPTELQRFTAHCRVAVNEVSNLGHHGSQWQQTLRGRRRAAGSQDTREVSLNESCVIADARVVVDDTTCHAADDRQSSMFLHAIW